MSKKTKKRKARPWKGQTDDIRSMLRDDEMFDAHFYELQHDCLSNVDEIMFLPRITGVDVRGRTVTGKVVHSVRDADTLIRSFVVIEVQ